MMHTYKNLTRYIIITIVHIIHSHRNTICLLKVVPKAGSILDCCINIIYCTTKVTGITVILDLLIYQIQTDVGNQGMCVLEHKPERKQRCYYVYKTMQINTIQ